MKISINGVSYFGNDEKEVEIKGVFFKIEGANNLQVIVNGDAGNVRTSNAKVTVSGNVTHGVQTSNGSIECGAVTGNVTTTNAKITVNGDVGGSVRTSNGSVYHGGVKQ